MGKDADQIGQEIAATRERVDEDADGHAHKADVPTRVREAVGGTVDAVRGAAAGAVETVTQSVGGAVEKVKDAAGETVDKAQSRIEATKSQLRKALPARDELVARARKKTGRFIEENALGVVAGAFAVGLLAGLALPGTRFEDERIGEVADRAKEQVREQLQESAAELLDRGKDLAQNAVEAAGAAIQAGLQS